jgi:hypothetical protein
MSAFAFPIVALRLTSRCVLKRLGWDDLVVVVAAVSFLCHRALSDERLIRG